MNEPSHGTLPSRKPLGHAGTPSAVWTAGTPIYFLTICAAQRVGSPLIRDAQAILDAARAYHRAQKWFIHLALVMPDHVHMLVSFPAGETMGAVVGDWKRFLSVRCKIQWQRNFFDHRIRNAAELSEKWDYIQLNPVRKELVSAADDWPHWIAFNPSTGTELTPRASR